MKLITSVVQSFKVARTFKDNSGKVNSIDVTADGKSLITSCDDDSISIYDCEKGSFQRTLHSKKYGADLIRFTHTENSAIHCSTKVDDTIRHLSLHDNKYIRYFTGHTKKVTSLCMSPTSDFFISSSSDKTIRIWDIRSNSCQGTINQSGHPVANFDPDGVMFAVGLNGETVKLYDIRMFEKNAVNSFNVPKNNDYDWTSVKFSPDGRMLLISTNGSIILLLDAYQGVLLQTFDRFTNDEDLPLEASFSPDSQFLFSGSTNGTIHVWNTDTGASTAILQSNHDGPVHCVQFNPKYMMLASACRNVVFWIPSVEEDAL